jgi:hypothetical protein
MLTFAHAVGAADVGYLTAVSPAAATMFSLVLLRLKSKISKPTMMSLASLLYLSLCVFIYLATSAYLQNLGWKICILYSLGEYFHSRFFEVNRFFKRNLCLTDQIFQQVVLAVQCLRARTKPSLPMCSLFIRTQRLPPQLPPAVGARHWRFFCFHIWTKLQWY